MKRTPNLPPEAPLGDMSPEEFRRGAAAAMDWIARYLDDPERHPVLSRVAPGEVRASLPAGPPEVGEEFGAILDDFVSKIIPGITHWNHPGFFAYFGVTGSAAGILGEALAASLNVNAMLWRTSPAATELEELSLDWLRQMAGLPGEFRGHIQDTASSSTLVATITAREATGLAIRDRGMSGRDLPALRMYCSKQAHSSVEKAAIAAGIGRMGVRQIPTDDAFRMRPEALEAAIQSDMQRGAKPFCIVATVGTTSTTSVDPVDEIGAIARRYGLWLHVDGAYAGAAALLPELRHLMTGWGQADSIVINPHKWLFVPVDCSALFLRDPEATRRAFSLTPEYLRTAEGDDVTNLMDYGIALGRRFRALKLWMTMRYFGRIGMTDRLRAHIALAREFASWVGAAAEWSVVAPVPFSTVCFRYDRAETPSADLDRLNRAILERVNESGEVFLSHTVLNDRYTLRLAVGNIRTELRHVQRAWELLRQAAIDLDP